MDVGIEKIAQERVISLRGLRRQYPSEAACREMLESMRWPQGPRCPRCGSSGWWRLDGVKCRPGLRQCRDCRYQYTVTTGTPMHATKLPLWTWIQAMYLVLTSSKGISSVVLSRVLGIGQSSAWRLGHSIREMMHNRDDNGRQLKGIVELDIKYLGGAPRPRKDGQHNPRGKASAKSKVLIAAQRFGPAQGTVIPAETADDIQAAVTGTIEPGSRIMSDNQRALRLGLAAIAGSHETVTHSAKEYVRGEVHSNTADAVGAMMERAKYGVWHRFSDQHVQRYVDEMCFRWSHRVRINAMTKDGRPRRVIALVPVLIQIRCLIAPDRGRRRPPDEADPHLRFCLLLVQGYRPGLKASH